MKGNGLGRCGSIRVQNVLPVPTIAHSVTPRGIGRKARDASSRGKVLVEVCVYTGEGTTPVQEGYGTER